MRIVPCSRTLSVLAKNLLITVTASLLLGTASSAWAAAIGVSFVGRGADPGDLLAPTDVAGVYTQANWANVRDDGTTFKGKAPALNDDSGNLTDVALIFDASDSWNSDGASTTTPDQKLMKGILKANPTPDLTPPGNTDRILLVSSNLPPAGVYTVIVYSIANRANAKMDMPLGSTPYNT